jgi:hypothetical protein
MTQPTYRRALIAARKDLDRLQREREEIDRKIARLRQTIISLGAVTRESKKREKQKHFISEKEPLTEAVQSVIAASEVPLHPQGIRRILQDLGYHITSSNPSASIWSVLKRLEDKRTHSGTGVVRMYEKRDKDDPKGEKGPRAFGYWWGDQNPPKPWVKSDLWEKARERSKTRTAEKASKKAEAETVKKS